MSDSINHIIRQAFDSITPLTDKDWQQIEEKFKTKAFNEGDHVIEAGEVCDFFGFVHSGIFRIYWTNKVNKKRSLHFFYYYNDISAYRSFIKQEPSKSSIQCLSAGKIIYITYADHVDLLKNHPSYKKITRVIRERQIIDIMARVFDFSFLTAEERYKKLLETQPDIFLQLPLSYISDYINIEPQSLSRIRNKVSKH